MNRAVIFLLVLSVFTVPALPARGGTTELDLYINASTGIRVGGSEAVDYYHDWSVGLDLGAGMQLGPLHVGVAGGFRVQALVGLLFLLWAATADYTEDDEPEILGEEIPIYFDFPVRVYLGVDGSSRQRFLDVFWGWYYRSSNIEEIPSAKDYEAGIAIGMRIFLLELSYIWPQTNRIRLTMGVHWRW